MGFKCLFMDNSAYTAQDVNRAISNIISGGISNYPLGVNALSDLNSAVTEIANGGTQYIGTSCLVVKNGSIYKISEGACIMNDGSQIVFDANGMQIPRQNGVYEYVYLERDQVANTIKAVVSTTCGGQDTVPLAEIDTDGNIIDKRKFASAKIALSAEPKNIGITKRINHGRLYSGDSFEFDTGFNGWKYIVYKFLDRNDNTGGCVELEDGGQIVNQFPDSNVSTHGIMYATTVTRHGTVLRFVYTGSSSNSGIINLEFELR